MPILPCSLLLCKIAASGDVRFRLNFNRNGGEIGEVFGPFDKFLQNGTFNATDRICPELTAWKTCHNLRIMHKALAATESQFLCQNRQHFLAIERGGTFIAESGQKAVRKFYAPL